MENASQAERATGTENWILQDVEKGNRMLLWNTLRAGKPVGKKTWGRHEERNGHNCKGDLESEVG